MSTMMLSFCSCQQHGTHGGKVQIYNMTGHCTRFWGRWNYPQSCCTRPLDRHKAHGRTRHRFRDRLGIAAVVFVRLDIRLHELGRHELDLVAMGAEAARPVMRAATGFDADE